MNCSFSNVITDFYKGGHTPVSISTGLFSLVFKHDLKICNSEERKIILDIIIII